MYSKLNIFIYICKTITKTSVMAKTIKVIKVRGSTINMTIFCTILMCLTYLKISIDSPEFFIDDKVENVTQINNVSIIVNVFKIKSFLYNEKKDCFPKQS